MTVSIRIIDPARVAEVVRELTRLAGGQQELQGKTGVDQTTLSRLIGAKRQSMALETFRRLVAKAPPSLKSALIDGVMSPEQHQMLLNYWVWLGAEAARYGLAIHLRFEELTRRRPFTPIPPTLRPAAGDLQREVFNRRARYSADPRGWGTKRIIDRFRRAFRQEWGADPDRLGQVPGEPGVEERLAIAESRALLSIGGWLEPLRAVGDGRKWEAARELRSYFANPEGGHFPGVVGALEESPELLTGALESALRAQLLRERAIRRAATASSGTGRAFQVRRAAGAARRGTRKSGMV